MALSYLHHRRDCYTKQAERALRYGNVVAKYPGPLTERDRQFVNMPIQDLVSGVQNGSVDPRHVLEAYARVAMRAHAKTNCATEILVPSAEAWLENGSINLQGPLAGVPISLKDNLIVGGYDTTVGYSSFVGNKGAEDGTMVKILKEAGAVPYVKTNIPITLLSFESANDVWGRTTNPYNPKYTPGGSTGGEGALLALGGRIGIGSDVAGSVRVPAHFSGVYTVRCSTGRWLKVGFRTSLPGQEGIPAVFSPMARTLNDLIYFTRAVISSKPWRHDYSIHPLEWRTDVEKEWQEKKRFRVGIMRTDGVVDPSPACRRALEIVEEALRHEGHEIVEIDPPSPYESLRLSSQLLVADGGAGYRGPFRWGEWEDRGAHQMSRMMRLPGLIRWVYYLWARYVRRDPVWAGLVRDWYPKSAAEYYQMVAQREAYKDAWFRWWNGEKLDFLVTPPNATPAIPHDGMKEAVSSCGYTFLFNMLDYTSGVLPVTYVDKDLDRLPAEFSLCKLNGVAQGAYKLYDADAMHGLPVGVQVVGRRLEEEKVLALMARIEYALGENKFRPLEVN